MSYNLPVGDMDPISSVSATMQRFKKLAKEVNKLKELLKTEHEIFGPLLEHESPHIRQTLEALTADKHHLYKFVHQLTVEERVNLLQSIEEQVNALGGAGSIGELEKSMKEIEDVVEAVNEFEERQQLIEERKQTEQRQMLMRELMETFKSLRVAESPSDEYFTAENESPSDEYFTAETSLTEEDYLTASDMSEEERLRHINALSNFGFRSGMGAIGSTRSNLMAMQAPRKINRSSERKLTRQSSFPARHDGRVPSRKLQRACSQNSALKWTHSKKIVRSPSFITSSPYKQTISSPRRPVRNEPAVAFSNLSTATAMEQELTAWSMRHSTEYAMKILLRQLRLILTRQ